MNKFLDELKYNVNSVTHKAKKGLLVGGLSLLAATSFVGCSKSSSENPVSIEKEQANADELEKKFGYISFNADELAEKFEALPSYSELSSEDVAEIENFLLSYTFAKTSQDFQGAIPADSIIPDVTNGKLEGTFSLSEEDRQKYFKTLEDQSSDLLYLDSECVEFYNSFPDYADAHDALSYIYTVKADLIEMKPELAEELTDSDILNLIKSSYVSAYNNRYPNDEYVKAVDNTWHINLLNTDFYSISTSLENEIRVTPSAEPSEVYNDYIDQEKNNSTVIVDYKDACIGYYQENSNSSILESLKDANEKNEVTTQQIINQIIDINLEKTKEEQQNQVAQATQNEHSSEDDELDR